MQRDFQSQSQVVVSMESLVFNAAKIPRLMAMMLSYSNQERRSREDCILETEPERELHLNLRRLQF